MLFDKRAVKKGVGWAMKQLIAEAPPFLETYLRTLKSRVPLRLK
jgi:hypothetical protein